MASASKATAKKIAQRIFGDGVVNLISFAAGARFSPLQLSKTSSAGFTKNLFGAKDEAAFTPRSVQAAGLPNTSTSM
jgi:hypothetical protein